MLKAFGGGLNGTARSGADQSVWHSLLRIQRDESNGDLGTFPAGEQQILLSTL